LNFRCASCGAENAPGEKFCGECGAALVVTAPASEQKASAAKATAPRVQVPAEQTDDFTALEGERKTITVLFADIKGSMSQIEDLDPEAARAIVDPALAIMAEAVNRYQGHVAQSTGDGVFALFGAPIAHEDLHSVRFTRRCGCSRSCGGIRIGCVRTAKRRLRFASGSIPARW
jgi:class 3 adenylate cyclase